MDNSKYLITGSSSGLGKYLYEHLGGTSWTRDIRKNEERKIIKKGANVIIHCAFNKARDVNSQNLYQYLSDNIFFTERLIRIPHKKFIYISSVDVYPKDGKKHREEEVISIKDVSGIYGIVKLMSESLVREYCPNFSILRCASFLGKDARGNSIMKIIKEDHSSITLDERSTFNVLLHEDVCKFITLAVQRNLQGVYNIASAENITLKEVVQMFKKDVRFGTFVYDAGNIDNTKAATRLPAFNKTSKEILDDVTSSGILL